MGVVVVGMGLCFSCSFFQYPADWESLVRVRQSLSELVHSEFADVVAVAESTVEFDRSVAVRAATVADCFVAEVGRVAAVSVAVF